MYHVATKLFMSFDIVMSFFPYHLEKVREPGRRSHENTSGVLLRSVLDSAKTGLFHNHNQFLGGHSFGCCRRPTCVVWNR